MAEAKNAWEALGLDQTSYDYLQAIYENLAAADAAKTDALAPYDQVPGGREAALANLLAELRRVGAGDPDDLSMIGTFDRVGTRNSLLNKALDLDAVDKHVRKGSTVTPPDLTPDLPAPENDATALDEGHRALLEEIGFDPTDNALAALRGVLGDMLLEAGSLSSDLEAGDT
ncbi:MAG: hypothetical protein EB060_07740, partial [Proteobacteria bacterium]|nr:hypothetical protein [Pseudomonadota bacterium]